MVLEVMKLIPEWKRAWKFASVQWSVVGILCTLVEIANQTWSALPPAIAAKIPNSSQIALALFILVLVGRLIKFKEKPDGPE